MRHFDPARPKHLGDRLAAALRRHLFEELWFAATVHGRLLPPLGANQSAAHLANTLDFIGVNYYARYQVTFTPDPRRLFGTDGYTLGRELSDPSRRGPYSQFDPDGLGVICRRLARFGRPIYITEHGLPDADDDQRPRWIVAQLAVLHDLIRSGLDIRGYFHWSFVDNFEWNDGWTMHFGLVGMDPVSQARTIRRSAMLYADIAKTNGISADQLATYGQGYASGNMGEK